MITYWFIKMSAEDCRSMGGAWWEATALGWSWWRRQKPKLSSRLLVREAQPPVSVEENWKLPGLQHCCSDTNKQALVEGGARSSHAWLSAPMSLAANTLPSWRLIEVKYLNGNILQNQSSTPRIISVDTSVKPVFSLSSSPVCHT